MDDASFDPLLHNTHYQVTNLSVNPLKTKLEETMKELNSMEDLGLSPQKFFAGDFILNSNDLKEPVEIRSFGQMIEELSKLGQKGLEVKRYKGLGEMEPKELRETTMDPQNRTLLEVTMLDKHAVNQAFIRLMGVEVKDRRQFIESRAAELDWDLLDI